MSPAKTVPREEPTVPAQSDSRQQVFLWLVAATILAGTIVRLVMYVSATPQYDEAYTHINFSTTSLWDAASLYVAPTNHIFYSILSRLAQIAKPGDILITRLPALLAGVAVIPATIFFARQVTDSRRVAVVAGVLAAFNPQLILYSAEARGYTMLALFGVIWAILGYRCATDEKVNVTSWVGLSVVSALGIWTVPIFVYAVVALAVWMLLVRWLRHGLDRRFMGQAALAGGFAVVLTSIALFPIFYRQGGVAEILNQPLLNATNPSLGGVPGRELSAFFDLLPGYLSDVALWMVEAIPTAVSVMLAILVLLGILSRRTPFALRVLVPVFVPVVVLVLMVQRLQPLARSWAPLLPLLIVTAAAGALSLRLLREIRPNPGPVATTILTLIVATLGLSSVAADYDSPMRNVAAADMEHVVELMKTDFPDGATLVVSRSSVPQARYWFSRHPDLVLGGTSRVVAIDHRLNGSLDDLAEMRHLYSLDGSEFANRAGVSKENLVPIAEFGSTTVYWNGK
ncbi:MAG TPA: hypothetical protein VFP42_14235 [Acidimicrobiia bacterium]|nr:hypothetical protein [Acidimicrobiia bacterium]